MLVDLLKGALELHNGNILCGGMVEFGQFIAAKAICQIFRKEGAIKIIGVAIWPAVRTGPNLIQSQELVLQVIGTYVHFPGATIQPASFRKKAFLINRQTLDAPHGQRHVRNE